MKEIKRVPVFFETQCRVLGAANSIDFAVLTCTVDTDHECDRRTDGRVDGQTSRRWLRRAMHSAIARKNCACMVYGRCIGSTVASQTLRS